MTKGKKWTLRLLGVAALALLICLCLMGSTMARYTSTGNGSGSLQVAVWDLETEKVDWETTKLSPSSEEYSSSEPRTHGSGDSVAVVTLNNNSDVSALVTLSLGEGLSLEEKEGFEWGTGFSSGYNQEANDYGVKIMSGFTDEDAFKAVLEAYEVITIELIDGEGEAITDGKEITMAAGESYVIYGDITWTSIIETNAQTEMEPSNYSFNSWAEFSDAVDTILGMYYDTISFTLTWSAVQASVLP